MSETNLDQNVKDAVIDVLREAQVLCEDYDDADLATALERVTEQPLSEDELRSLFTKVVTKLKAGRSADAASRAQVVAEVREIVNELVAHHLRGDGASRRHLELQERNGMPVRPVKPDPVFLGKRIELREGFVDVTQLGLWSKNRRLLLHVNEFSKTRGRKPEGSELFDLLLGNIVLEGVDPRDRDDQFKIQELAASISVSGVRVPPIIDWWGTPYDGNRRIAACLYILTSGKFNEAEKDKARWIKVWQAPKDTTGDEIEHIVVSLNFEKDLKEAWPEYVRAKQVFDDFEERSAEAQRTQPNREPNLLEIRKQVAKKFGIKTEEVKRYVRMIEWAEDFGEYHRQEGRPEAEVDHRANRYIQYFDEIAKTGRGDHKLSTQLLRDDAKKAVVFDLLYDGKFKRFAQIRDLPKVFSHEKASKLLEEAVASPHVKTAQVKLDDAITEARRHDLAKKQIGAEERVLNFTKWLEEDATQQTWREHMSLEVLERFLAVIRAAEGTVASVVAERSGASN